VEENSSSVVSQIVSLLPLALILLVLFYYLYRAFRRQDSIMEIGRENTQAVKENTEVLKAILVKLESRDKS
jgi:preprotein translocase subunit YajC